MKRRGDLPSKRSLSPRRLTGRFISTFPVSMGFQSPYKNIPLFHRRCFNMQVGVRTHFQRNCIRTFCISARTRKHLSLQQCLSKTPSISGDAPPHPARQPSATFPREHHAIVPDFRPAKLAPLQQIPWCPAPYTNVLLLLPKRAELFGSSAAGPKHSPRQQQKTHAQSPRAFKTLSNTVRAQAPQDLPYSFAIR